MKILLLPEREVIPLLRMREVIEAVETAFKEKALGRGQMPPKPYLFYTKHNGDLRTMPAYLEELDISAVKIVNVHPDNPKKHKLPTVMAIIVLINPKTGAPLAIMGGTYITAMRTGAAGGVAAKHLARKDSRVVGIVGAGAQSRTQLMALNEILKDIEKVKVADRIKTSREKYALEMTRKLGLDIKAVESIKAAVEGSDVVVTTTPARVPIIKTEWVENGCHINAMGADAPEKEELDPELLKRAKVVVDDWEQASHTGEINVPLKRGIISKENIFGEIGEVVAGLKPGRASVDEITIFDSTGLAVQDAVTAQLAYKKALEKKNGQFIELL